MVNSAQGQRKLMEIIDELRRHVRGEVLQAEPMSRHTSYRIGGPAQILVIARDSDEAARVYRFALRHGVSLTVLGGGTNVIAPDEGVTGIVLKLKCPRARIDFGDGTVTADAGVGLYDLAMAAARRGLGGLTDVAGVPGTVGGAILMNAQVVGAATGDLVEWVEVLTASGKRRIFRRGELTFGYRRSIFQGSDWLILRAAFGTEPGEPRMLAGAIESEWKRWRSSFPLEPPNAGSVFKRPPGDYAGRLIEEAGCKGLRVGGAEVSETHANFIYNGGNATAADVVRLIAEIRRRVFERSGVYLELEQILLPSRRCAECP